MGALQGVVTDRNNGTSECQRQGYGLAVRGLGKCHFDI